MHKNDATDASGAGGRSCWPRLLCRLLSGLVVEHPAAGRPHLRLWADCPSYCPGTGVPIPHSTAQPPDHTAVVAQSIAVSPWPTPGGYRGTIMEGAPPTRADDHDRLRLLPVPPPQPGGGKKKGPATSANPSSDPAAIISSSNARLRRDVRIVADRSFLKIYQSSANLSSIASGNIMNSRILSGRGSRNTSHAMFIRKIHKYIQLFQIRAINRSVHHVT